MNMANKNRSAQKNVKEKQERLSVDIPVNLYKALKIHAIHEDKKMREVIIEALKNHIEESEYLV